MTIKKIIYIFFSYLVRLNFFFIKNKIKCNYLVNSVVSFGDSFTFYIQNYDRIINKGYKIITISNFEKKIAELFYNNNKIHNIFFSIPAFIPVYSINVMLKKLLEAHEKFSFSYKKNMGYKQKKILENILQEKNKSVSTDVQKFKKKKYVLFLVKHYNNDNNDIKNGNFRQTSDLKKIFKVIDFLIRKNVKIIVLGSKNEKITKILKNFYNNKKNIFFFYEISKKETMIDQLFIHYHSQLSIGTDCGAFIMSVFLKKKILYFDSLKGSEGIELQKNITFLHKKIIFNNNSEIFSHNKASRMINSMNKAFTIKECTFLDIKKSINKLL